MSAFHRAARRGTAVDTLLIGAEAPGHRVERAPPEAGRVPLLTALRPERGWPHWLVWVPMRWCGGWAYEPLPLPWRLETFVPPGVGQPGAPWRTSQAVEAFPPSSRVSPRMADAKGAGGGHGSDEDDGREERDEPGERGERDGGERDIRGLLLVALYLEPRALAMEGAHRGVMHALDEEALRAQVDGALAQFLDLPPHRWAHGFVPSPDDTGAGADGKDDAAGDGVCFVLAACQYPPGLLDVSPGWELDASQAGPGLASLARLHRFTRSTARGRSCSLVLFAGDQIYADASGGLADSRSGIERYARGYGEFKAGPVRLLPPTVARVVHGIDDHEIVDNWEPSPGASHDGNGPWFDVARQAAWDHRWDAGARIGGPQLLWHDIDWRGAAFFIADARCERESRRVANWSSARLWSTAQRDAFGAWLSRAEARPKFVMSGSLPLPRRRTTVEHAASCLRSDAWDGYPHSLHELLGAVWRHRATGLVFLSGDEHRSGWVSAEISAVDGGDPAPVRIHSVHSSALYAPWPFAITAAEELAAPDAFEFDGPDGRRLRCVVGAWADHPGDGFAVLRVAGDRIDLWFDRSGPSPGAPEDTDAPDAQLLAQVKLPA
ncbi:alkaline phosphatase D family protein [Roseateles chitinivorans]|uniref:alkaline phosphatase D family protein n=1 Tax=Roseateles chitinivorans TaxID=2917965 RepID=UPI003D66F311